MELVIAGQSCSLPSAFCRTGDLELELHLDLSYSYLSLQQQIKRALEPFSRDDVVDSDLTWHLRVSTLLSSDHEDMYC